MYYFHFCQRSLEDTGHEVSLIWYRNGFYTISSIECWSGQISWHCIYIICTRSSRSHSLLYNKCTKLIDVYNLPQPLNWHKELWNWTLFSESTDVMPGRAKSNDLVTSVLTSIRTHEGESECRMPTLEWDCQCRVPASYSIAFTKCTNRRPWCNSFVQVLIYLDTVSGVGYTPFMGPCIQTAWNI